MGKQREIHSDFQYHLKYKEQELIGLFTDLRNYIFELYPEVNELLYHTHALTSVFTVSEKMGDGFCTIPIYTNHLNLAFNKGTLLNDSKKIYSLAKNIQNIFPKDTIDKIINDSINYIK